MYDIMLATAEWLVSWLITSLSIGKDTGIVALEGVVEKTFPKALEDHLLTWTHTNRQRISFDVEPNLSVSLEQC